MKKYTGLTSVILSISLILSLFTGCTTKKADNGDLAKNSGSGVTNSSETVDVKPQLPIVDKKITLRYWIPLPGAAAALIKDYNENDVYIEMEKRTNIHIEFMHPTSPAEQFNLMIASGDIPDIIGNATRYLGGGEKGVEDKIYLKLNDMLPKYAPNYQKLRMSNPEIARQTINDNGLIWAFYQIVPYEEVISTGPIINKNWLDELNLKEPKTIDDWYNMLKAFRDKKGSTAPLQISENGYGNGGVFTSAFDTGESFILKDGKVKFGFIEPGFKDYLTLMNTWYKEGLIDKDFSKKKGAARDAAMSNQSAGAYIQSPDTAYTMLKPLGIEINAPDFPVLTPGQKLHYRSKFDYSFTPSGNATTAISAQSKYTVEAIKWMDYGYSQEGHMLYNFGIEGKTYNMVNGKPVYTDLMLNNPEGISMNNLITILRVHDGPFMRLATKSNPIVLNYADSIPIRSKWTNNVGSEFVLPPITLNAEENNKNSEIMPDINTYKDQMIIKFITGAEPISRFDEYISNIKNMGIEEAIKMRQDALERYNKR